MHESWLFAFPLTVWWKFRVIWQIVWLYVTSINYVCYLSNNLYPLLQTWCYCFHTAKEGSFQWATETICSRNMCKKSPTWSTSKYHYNNTQVCSTDILIVLGPQAGCSWQCGCWQEYTTWSIGTRWIGRWQGTSKIKLIPSSLWYWKWWDISG